MSVDPEVVEYIKSLNPILIIRGAVSTSEALSKVIDKLNDDRLYISRLPNFQIDIEWEKRYVYNQVTQTYQDVILGSYKDYTVCIANWDVYP